MMARTYLLDTNVVSELRPRRQDPRVIGWLKAHRDSDVRLSVMSVGELRRGVEGLRRNDSQSADYLDRWLHATIDGFGDHLVPVTREIAEGWGRLAVPDPLPIIDGLLAATALVHDWTLVTRNTKDVERTGVKLLNPWEWSE